MKKYLLAGTAVATAALVGGVAGAAEAPTWKLTGNANFQFYWVDQDNIGQQPQRILMLLDHSSFSQTWGITQPPGGLSPADYNNPQDHDWYFGVDEAELQLNVSGTADNGLKYGFKIEINANTTDNAMADEARLQLSGGWGTIQLGDEDGAEDIMNFGGENLMGATGGFDGDFDDVLLRSRVTLNGVEHVNAPSYPTIAGDSGDSTKVSYFSPRFSGFQVGASITPEHKMSGDAFKQDKAWEDGYGIGANYDNSFGDLRIRASAVYATASSRFIYQEDISAWSVGGIVGWGPFSLGANYTDNGESGQFTGDEVAESSYWNVAASFETGPLHLSAGYFASEREWTGTDGWFTEASTFENIALTVDYTMAPGLGVYAEVDIIDDDIGGADCIGPRCDNAATIFIAGVNVSF